MNKLIAIMILLIVIAMSVVIITSENVNIPVKYDKPLSIEKINNTTFIDYSNYYVEEKVINGVNEIRFIKNTFGNTTNDIYGSIPSGDNYTVNITFNGNGNVSRGYKTPCQAMVGYIQGFSNSGSLKFNAYIYLDYGVYNLICGYTTYAKFNLTFTNLYYNANYQLTSFNDSITYLPNSIQYNSNSTLYNYNSQIQSYVSSYNITYFISSFSSTNAKYEINFSAKNNAIFSLNISNLKYINVKTAILFLPDGVYTYNYTINNITNSNILYVDNANVSVVLQVSQYSNNYVLYLYLIITFTGLALVGKYTRGFIISYSLSGLLFLFIGYKEQIEFFTQNTIILIITFLAILFTYKVVMED
jgi:hypothetical protein